MGGRRGSHVVAANTFDAMFLVGGYFARKGEPALVSSLSGPQASDTRSYRGVCLDVLTSGDWTNVTRGNGVGEERLLDLGTGTNHSCVHCSIRAFLVVLPS
jgi:hypothetical protein